MAERGEWRGVSASDAGEAALAPIGIVGYVATQVLYQLREAGLLLRQDFYVPSPTELYDLYYQIDSVAANRLPFRWVMCAETANELDKLYGNKKYAKLNEFAWSFAEVHPLESTVKSGYVFSQSPPRLFDVPIRIDPAARTPMIELVDE